MISGFLYTSIGPKPAFIAAFSLAFTGAVLYLSLAKNHEDIVPFILILGKFGLSAAFNLVYVANSIFPTVYATTTMGICSIFARITTIFAPMIAEAEDPIPMIIFTVLTGIPIVLSALLKVQKIKKEDTK